MPEASAEPMPKFPEEPPILRLVPTPDHANARGDIFGGWMMSQLDIAGGILAALEASGPVATIAVKELKFLQPLFVYNRVSIYGRVGRVGRTSVAIHLSAYAERGLEPEVHHVAEAEFVYVAVSSPGVKRVLEPKAAV